MPLGLLPAAENKIVLYHDQKMDNPPVFIFPFLTGRQQLELIKINEQFDQVKDVSSGIYNLLYNTLAQHLLSWDNLVDKHGEPLRYCDYRDQQYSGLDTILSITEAMELFIRLMNQLPPDALKKKSDLPSDTLKAGSAKNA